MPRPFPRLCRGLNDLRYGAPKAEPLGVLVVHTRLPSGPRLEAVVKGACRCQPLLLGMSFVAIVIGQGLVPVGLGYACLISLIVTLRGQVLGGALLLVCFAGLIAVVERIKAVPLLCGRAGRKALLVGVGARHRLCHGYSTQAEERRRSQSHNVNLLHFGLHEFSPRWKNAPALRNVPDETWPREGTAQCV